MDEFNGANINATGGLADNQQIRVTLNLARQNDFLLVAAGKFCAFEIGVIGAHVEILHLGPAAADNCIPVEPEALAEGFVIVPAENAGFRSIKS